MTNKTIPLPRLAVTDLIRESVKNAELVVHYISESGIDVDKRDIQIITKAKEMLDNDQWNAQIEVAFWMSYKNLTRSIQPVTVDSLKASQETLVKNPNFFQKILKTKRRDTLAYRVVRFYTIFAVLTMIIMLVLHIYFSIGTIRLNRIQSADERINDLQKQLSEINMMIGTGNNSITAIQKRDDITDKLSEVNTEKKTNIDLLNDWVFFIQRFFLIKNQPTSSETVTDNSEPGPPSIPDPQSELNHNIAVIQKAQNYVLVIGLYILPLFYGLLGALTYVLRDLSNQTHKMQYTKESNINHILRLILGTIAGLAVGVFWGDIKQQENFMVIRSLGPLIVAYLSGLTVEYVFTAIEKFVGTWLERALSIQNDKKNS